MTAGSDGAADGDVPFFSVVIPTYNRAHIVRETIESVLAQTDPDFEVIVVDDGSTDATGDVVAEVTDPRVSYVRKQNAERGAARNFGAARALGRYVNFVDSDDVLYPHHLATARRLIAIADHPEILHLGYEMKDGAGAVIARVDSFEGRLNNYLPSGN